MDRLRKLSQQVVAAKADAVTHETGRVTPKVDLPDFKVPDATAKDFASTLSPEKRMELFQILMKYRESIDNLEANGTPPPMTLFDMGLATHNEGAVPSAGDVADYIDTADPFQLKVLDTLPGPWRDAASQEAKIKIMQEISLSAAQGHDIHLYAKWQKTFGGRGLSSNIVVPQVGVSSWGTKIEKSLKARVLVSDAKDAERLARIHVQKEGNFEPVLFDSLIATRNNESWREQRSHLTEAFLPLSSLAKILPVSLERAKKCAQRLKMLVADSREVDMSDFLLHEAQAQLQLALLGAPEELMDKTNETFRATFASDDQRACPGQLGEGMSELMRLAMEDDTLGLPSDARQVRGPLSRAVQSSNFTKTADYGNMLLILFAGHDTTGHTMTWLLFELCRNPAIQLELQAEVDAFFQKLNASDPTYQDLSELDFMDRCVTEALRLWPAVPNGTFRQLQFEDTVTGPDGKDILLPKGTAVQILNWARHRNQELWGDDANKFNPKRHFKYEELARVGCPMAAANPQSDRFSPFAHNPRSCLGKNFAQMEMRLIMLYLLRDFSFSLAPAYQRLMNRNFDVDPVPEEFRGINRATMGPMDLEHSTQHSWGTRPLYAMKLVPHPRAKRAPL